MGGQHGQDGHPVFCFLRKKKKISFGLTLEGETGAILVKDGGLGNMRPMKGEQACALQN